MRRVPLFSLRFAQVALLKHQLLLPDLLKHVHEEADPLGFSHADRVRAQSHGCD